MGISAEATEAKAVTLIGLCRTALAIGGELRGQSLKDAIAQIESSTVNDLSGRTNKTAVFPDDGRNATETSTGIASLATEAKAVALLTKCRDMLAVGGSIRGQDVKDLLDQLQNFTTADTSGRTDKAVDNFADGRNAAEVTVIT